VLAEPVADRDGARIAGALDPSALDAAFRRALAVRVDAGRALEPVPVVRLSQLEERARAREAGEVLPFHASPKPIACLDAAGRLVAPREPNGYKLERFVFDLLPEARALVMVEARREDEYAPVKNADGSESPPSARRALETCMRRWLSGAGLQLPPDFVALELDHSVVDGPEDAASLSVRDAAAAGSLIRMGPGVTP